MKSKILLFSLAALLAFRLFTALAVNPGGGGDPGGGCGATSCSEFYCGAPGTIVNPGALTWTNLTIGTEFLISPPLLTNTLIAESQGWYVCSNNCGVTYHTNYFTYDPTNWWVPPIPTIFTNAGTFYFTNFVQGIAWDDTCPDPTIISNAGIIIITVTNTLLDIIVQPVDQVAPLCGTATFSVGVIGAAPFSYQWRLDGTNLAGATASTLTLTHVQLAQTGYYSVVVTNAYGSIISSNALLTVVSCTASPAGLISWWRAEGNGLDSAGTNHGTLNAGVNYDVGKVGQAFSFHGANVIDIPDSASLSYSSSNLTNYSMEAWIKPTALADNLEHQCLILGDPYGLGQIYTRNGSTGVYAVIMFDTPTLVYEAASSNQIPLGTFAHMVGTWDGTRLKIYVNGVLQGQNTPGAFPPTDPNAVWHIGGWANSVMAFSGLIDEVSLYNRALTGEEVGALYDASAAGKCTGTECGVTTLCGGARTNFTFRADTTYHICSPVDLYGTTVFEGSTVIKFDGSGFIIHGPIECRTDSYRPAIFTSKDDDSVGRIIPGSSGSPEFSEGAGYFTDAEDYNHDVPWEFKNARFKFSGGYTVEAYFRNLVFRNCQFVHCHSCADARNITLQNVLLYDSGNSIWALDVQESVLAEHVTMVSCQYLSHSGQITIKNSIFWGGYAVRDGGGEVDGSNNGFYLNEPMATNAIEVMSDPFQSVGAGNCYLTNDCVFLNAGTTNIDPTLLAEIRQKTTRPPTVLSNVTATVNTNLDLQAFRDTDAPDLGYHYDPIDYITHNFVVTNATVTLTNGTVVASYNDKGIRLQGAATLNSIGTPLQPNWLVRYSSVQEQAVSLGQSGPEGGIAVTAEAIGAGVPSAALRFTDFACPANGGFHLYHTNGSAYASLTVRDCELWSGNNELSGPVSGTTGTGLKNNLFYRSSLHALTANASTVLSLSNNLAWGTTVTLSPATNGLWHAFNNAFDNCTIATNACRTNGYNAYINCSGRLMPTNSHDIVLGSFNYTNGPLGGFYHVSTNLLNRGSVTADTTGLYHYTTRTNQVKETNSVVDIGYHYVAVDADGDSVDTDGDGQPDYVEDGNGNGGVDSGETDPNDYYNGGLPQLIVVSGDNQTGPIDRYLPFPLVIMVTDSNSVALANAPLTLTVTTGTALVATSTNGPASGSLQVNSGMDGQVEVWVKTPPHFDSTSIITITAFSGTNTVQTNVTERTMAVSAMIASGDNRIMRLLPGGDLVSWGANGQGQLGDWTHLDSTNPVHVVGLTNVVKVASGYYHSLAIDANGALWAWGENGAGQLGTGDIQSTNLPVQVSGMTNGVIAAAANIAYSVALKSGGSVWVWGSPFGAPEAILEPVLVPGLTNVTAVAAGYQHTLVVSNGTVWSWGNNDYGQLGDGTTSASGTPILVSGLSNITAICAGGFYSLALDTNGVVWSWGLNEFGQLGDGSYDNRLTPAMVGGVTNLVVIAAGWAHTMALDGAGMLWVWGENGSGQLGTGDFDSRNIPVVVTNVTNLVAVAPLGGLSVVLDNEGGVWQWGNGVENPAAGPQQYTDFYNGQLPGLEIIGGNNQSAYQLSAFAEPLVFRIKDTNGVPLGDAPVSIEVIAGDMSLSLTEEGDSFGGIRTTSDENGEVTLFGRANDNVQFTNCTVKVLAASREKVVRLDFAERVIQAPTLTILTPTNNSVLLVDVDQNVNFTVQAESIGGSVNHVYYFAFCSDCPNGGVAYIIGTSSVSPFSFTWTNAPTASVEVGARAVDEGGTESSSGYVPSPAIVELDIILDADANYMGDEWEVGYFGNMGVDPDADPDGDNITNLQEFQAGTSPVDFYNGIPPQLEIIGGNDQHGAVDSFLPLLLTVRVTDTNSLVLTNAPLVFTVTRGGAMLAVTNDETLETELEIRSDVNGLAAIRVYFPSNVYLLQNTILVRAQNEGDIVETEAFEVVPGRLNSWRFDTTEWLNEIGYPPLSQANLLSLADWSGFAVRMNSEDPAYLNYRDIEATGEGNINLRRGTVRFWLKPEWASGVGPQSEGQLFGVGARDAVEGWWGLVVNAEGTELSFVTQTNGVGTTNLTANLGWNATDWHQVAICYSPTNTALYLDGRPIITNGPGIATYPGVLERGNGFWIGSDKAGASQARSLFDEFETFNYPLGEQEIATNYASIVLAAPTISLLATNAATGCLVSLAQAHANELISSVSGESFPNPFVYLITEDRADAIQARSDGLIDSRPEGLNITKLPCPIITPQGGSFNFTSNVVLSLALENLTNLVSGLFRTELGRAAAIDELDTVVAVAQGLREESYDDESIRTNLINSTSFRGSLEYFSRFGVYGDPYQRNDTAGIEYSLDGGLNWTNYVEPIPITNSVTLLARAKKSGTTDDRAHYFYLTSEAASAQFTYISDGWLVEHFGIDYQNDPDAEPDADPDHDGLDNAHEYAEDTDPSDPDTDYDGRNDGQEIADGTDPTDSNSVTNVSLAYWRFNTTNWLGEAGQVPLGFTNLSIFTNWSLNAVQVDSNNPAYLKYRDMEPSGDANLNLRVGTIRFWFKPNWTSGTGPLSEGRLIEMGSRDTASGWWSLVVNPDGTALQFISQTNGMGTTNLTATIDWDSNEWHQITITYGPSDSRLYVDGQPVVTNGLGVSYYPPLGTRTNGFCVGSDKDGTQQARGQFDELQTFNHQLAAGSVLDQYEASLADRDGDGLSNTEEALLGTDPHDPDTDGDGVSDYLEYRLGRNPLSGGAVFDADGIINLQIYTLLLR